MSASVRTLTVKIVRSLLEEDLKVEKGSLDPYREFIRAVLDKVSIYNDCNYGAK